jgi:hypothetical protein
MAETAKDNPDTADIDESRNDDGDPHLEPLSPCIQVGDPVARISSWATDLDGQPRRMDKIVDIGVDEFCPWGIAILRPRGGEVLIGGTMREVVWQCSIPSVDSASSSADDGDWQVLT